MPDPSLSAAIREAYAVAPKGVVVHHTIELRHPTFIDDVGQPTAIRVVLGFHGIEARLEASAPLHAGAVVKFIAMAFAFEEPELGAGAVPEMPLSIDNVGSDISDALDDAAVSADPVYVTYRPYRSTALLDGPEYQPPITLVLVDVVATPARVTGRARMPSPADKQYPGEVYTAEAFPGLEQ